jgi:hypothetical protein
VDFVELERSAADAVESRGKGRVATVFPVADALRNPELGFVDGSRRVVEIEYFSRAGVAKLQADPPDMVVVCNRQWDPLGLLTHPSFRDFAEKHYGYIPELRAEEIAEILSMQIVGRWNRRGMSMELLARTSGPQRFH